MTSKIVFVLISTAISLAIFIALLFSVGFMVYIANLFNDDPVNLVGLLMFAFLVIPALITSLALGYVSMKKLSSKVDSFKSEPGVFNKLYLASIPVTLVVMYLIREFFIF